MIVNSGSLLHETAKDKNPNPKHKPNSLFVFIIFSFLFTPQLLGYLHLQMNKAFELLKGINIDIKTLFNMEIPNMRKLKFIPFALFGAKFHCKLIAMMHKKLC